MQRLNAVVSFCDDVREEANDKTTAVGIMPTNLAADTFPIVLPKLVVFITFSLHGYNQTTVPFNIKMTNQDNEPIFEGILSFEIHDTPIFENTNGTIHMGSGQIGLGMLQIEKPGFFHVVVEHEGEFVTEAVMSFIQKQLTKANGMSLEHLRFTEVNRH